MENILLIILLVLNIIDAITTYIGIKKYNLLEKNGILNFLIQKIGLIPTLILMKGVVIGLILYCLILNITLSVWLIIPLIALYIFVVFNNFKVIKNSS